MWPNPQFLVGLVTFTEEILNGKLHFLCSVPYTYTVGLLLHLQYYQKCEPIILKVWLKCKFVLWQSRYYKLLTENKDKKIHVFWSTHFFFFLTAAAIPRKLSNIIFRLQTFGKVYIVKINYFSERPNKMIDYHAGDIGNKNIAGKY